MIDHKNVISIKQAEKQKEGDVIIRGWVHRERGSSQRKFIVLRDVTGIIQCVIEKTVVNEEQFQLADKTHVEASMYIYGTVKEDTRSPTGFELSVKELELVNESVDFPITKDQSIEWLADNRHLWLRSRKETAILKIRSAVFGAIHEYFRSNKFYEFQSPILQSTQAEGGSSLFTVDYFGKPMYLAQTWQLHAEAAIFSLEKIYCIAPSFRAEKSKTSRHLTEYWHAEMEVAWASFEDILNYGEGLIKHIVKKVLENHQEELKILERNTTILQRVITEPFIRMTYDETIKVLKEKCNLEIEWGKDLRTNEEDELSKLYENFIIVTNYPKKVKAFYMKEDDKNPEVVHGCDFIAPESYGEIIGGSEREADINKIKKRLIEQGEDPENYSFYLDTRKYGSVPHGGFGMGVERIVSWICKLENIKDAIAFPRTLTRFKP